MSDICELCHYDWVERDALERELDRKNDLIRQMAIALQNFIDCDLREVTAFDLHKKAMKELGEET